VAGPATRNYVPDYLRDPEPALSMDEVGPCPGPRAGAAVYRLYSKFSSFSAQSVTTLPSPAAGVQIIAITMYMYVRTRMSLRATAVFGHLSQNSSRNHMWPRLGPILVSMQCTFVADVCTQQPSTGDVDRTTK